MTLQIVGASIPQLQCETDSGIDTIPLSEEVSFGSWQQAIPDEYWSLDADQLNERVRVARATLGDDVIVLGHHYQREDIIEFADERGDSFVLAQYAAERPESKYIVFCGVHFMAEAADILSGDHQKVVLPNMEAGCSMADMASAPDVHAAWRELGEHFGGTDDIIPVTYMNSAASLKAFCGENGGVVCTSSNAERVLEWAFERGKRVFFFPDQHLGRNTGLKLGIPPEQMLVWNPFKPMGGHTEEELKQSKAILWQGHCSVHTRFTVSQINKARAAYPDINVIVHPECIMETVQAADSDGSTEFIIKTINEAPAGSKWAVGTEISLVNRLALENPDKLVFCLDSVVCPCSTMYRTHPAYLLWAMDCLLRGEVTNQIDVDEETARYARIALDRMLNEV